jgi:hypothetical protein
MAHYALLDENNTVVNVITGWDEDQLIEGKDPETWYGEFHNLKCKRTSRNTHAGVHVEGGTPFRKNYAVIGGVYDESRDAFIGPKPFPSWTLDEEKCCWVPPTPEPKDEKLYYWDEATVSWKVAP